MSAENNAYSLSTLNLTNSEDNLYVKNCNFLKCKSNGIGGAIFYRYLGSNPSSTFKIQKCSFISCSATSSGCVYASGCNIIIQNSCAMSNYAKHIQIFDCISTFQNLGAVTCEFSQFDQCSLMHKPGESTSLFVNSPSISFKSNNHTRCNVRDSACCGYFASQSEIKYLLNTNTNCTGSNYVIFYAREGTNQIENCLFYMCHSFDELNLKGAFYFSGSKIVIKEFHFFRTQLNFLAKPIQIINNEGINSKIVFLNCISDIRRNSIKYNSNCVSLENFEFENKASVVLKLIDYANWKCATEPLPARTRLPSMSIPMIENDIEKKENQIVKSYSNAYIEIMLYFGLTIIILITLNIQLIDYRQNSRIDNSSIDESSVLMDHTDYDASFEDDSIEFEEDQPTNYVSI